MFEITRTIYSNCERPEQFLVTECFFNLYPGVRFLRSNKLEQLEFKWEKILVFRNLQEKLENYFSKENYKVFIIRKNFVNLKEDF
jgi:hypothetical protein